MNTIYAELLVSEQDILGYSSYVFKCLEKDASFGHQFVLVTRLPNWQHRDIKIGEVGYLTYKEVEAGLDKWYCQETNQMIPYRYSNIYFIKFIEKQDNSKKDIII